MTKQLHIELCLQMMTAWGKIKSNIERIAEEDGLTLQQVGLLHKLYEDEELLMGALAKRLHCDASNVTGIVDRLELRGLIARQDVPSDRRAKKLVITKNGRNVIDAILPHLPDGLGLEKLNVSELSEIKRIFDKLG